MNDTLRSRIHDHPPPPARGRRSGEILALLFTGSLCATAFAQSLPTQGYYRAGEYMPVMIDASSRETRITASHALPDEVSASPGARVVPVLFLDESAREIRIGERSLSLQPLHANQRLIAVVDAEPAIAPSLFPDAEHVIIRLALNDLQRAIPMSFDALDALAISPEAYRQLNEWTIETLLDCEIIVAVRSSSAPDSTQHWRKIGEYQIAQRVRSRHFNALPREEAYQPISNWRPQRSGEARWLIVAVAGLIGVMFFALSLLPRRWSAAGIVFVAVVSTGVTALISKQRNARTWTTITTYESNITRYFASADDRHFEEPLPRLGYPVPFSVEHAGDLNLKMKISGENVHLAFDLTATRRLCVLARTERSSP